MNHRADVKPILAYVYQKADVIAFDCMADVFAMFSSIEQMLSQYGLNICSMVHHLP